MNDATNVDVLASVVFRVFMHWMFEYLLYLSSLLMPFEAIHMQNIILKGTKIKYQRTTWNNENVRKRSVQMPVNRTIDVHEIVDSFSCGWMDGREQCFSFFSFFFLFSSFNSNWHCTLFIRKQANSYYKHNYRRFYSLLSMRVRISCMMANVFEHYYFVNFLCTFWFMVEFWMRLLKLIMHHTHSHLYTVHTTHNTLSHLNRIWFRYFFASIFHQFFFESGFCYWKQVKHHACCMLKPPLNIWQILQLKWLQFGNSLRKEHVWCL